LDYDLITLYIPFKLLGATKGDSRSTSVTRAQTRNQGGGQSDISTPISWLRPARAYHVFLIQSFPNLVFIPVRITSRFSAIFLLPNYLSNMSSSVCNLRLKREIKKFCKANWSTSRDYTVLPECNRSRLASLKFPFAIILAGAIIALW